MTMAMTAQGIATPSAMASTSVEEEVVVVEVLVFVVFVVVEGDPGSMVPVRYGGG